MNSPLRRIAIYVILGAMAGAAIRRYGAVLTPQGRNLRAVRRFVATNHEAAEAYRASHADASYWYMWDDTRRGGALGVSGTVASGAARSNLLTFIRSLAPPRPIVDHLKIIPSPDYEERAEYIRSDFKAGLAQEERCARD